MYFLLFLLASASASNILGVFFNPSQSHQNIYQTICKELLTKGHKLTILTSKPINDPSLKNLDEIDLSSVVNQVDDSNLQNHILGNYNAPGVMKAVFEYNEGLTKAVLNSTQFKNFIWNENNVFDLVLKDFMEPTGFVLGHKFGAPVIDISPGDLTDFANDRIGNPNHPVLYPVLFLNYVPGKLSIPQKFNSVYFFLWQKYYYYQVFVPRMDRILREYFQEDFPYLENLEKNVSMFFTNRNFLLHTPRPNVPACIEISPVDNSKPKTLPQELKNVLDNAKQGVIYISFGSQIKTTSLTSKFTLSLMQAISELPYMFFLKWDGDLPTKPSNVITRKWFPQKDILAHKNVKAFVTNGGQQSVEQAIIAEVPMVGVPIGLDQHNNIRRVIKLKIGTKVDHRIATKVHLKNAITNVAETKKYRVNIKEAHEILIDKPLTGLYLAVWWAEYVIRHNGARHLRSPAIDMHWIQYLLLDVIAFLLMCAFLTLFVIYKFINFVGRLFRRKDEKKLKQN